MSIDIGRRVFHSAENLEAGQLIEFGYNGTPRLAVVITAAYKMNCDCYVFDSSDLIIQEGESEITISGGLEVLLEHVATQRPLGAGELYNQFGNQYVFKSFNLPKLGQGGLQNIEFDTYSEGEITTRKLRAEGEATVMEDAVLIWGEDTFKIQEDQGLTVQGGLNQMSLEPTEE